MLRRISLVLLAAGSLGIFSLIAAPETTTPAKDKNSSAATSPEADKAWTEVLDASKPPPPPAEWAGTPPTAEQRAEFYKFLASASEKAANKAQDFYTKYPKDPRVEEARERESRMRKQIAHFEQESAPPGEKEKIRERLNGIIDKAKAKQPEGTAAVFAEFEKGLKELVKDYPKEPALWQQFLMIAQNSDEATQKRIAKELMAAENAPDELKDEAKAILKRLDAVGQPFELAFTALDGRPVDVQKMKGKVVLIDFWATWCGPCIQELPNVIETYNKLHPKGFEIVSISLDKDKKTLEKFIADKEMTWPQFFDGKGWGNKISLQFNITAIPTMYLVDKKGVLRDLSAREDLEEKVKKLLAEN